MNRSDENIERVIKKEMEVVLYHIQILKQELHQVKNTSEVNNIEVLHLLNHHHHVNLF
jgi:hypothetical protein